MYWLMFHLYLNNKRSIRSNVKVRMYKAVATLIGKMFLMSREFNILSHPVVAILDCQGEGDNAAVNMASQVSSACKEGRRLSWPFFLLLKGELAGLFLEGERFTKIVRSPYYMALEVLKRNDSQEVDVWTAGVVLYILLCGVPPFWAGTEQGVSQAVVRGIFSRDGKLNLLLRIDLKGLFLLVTPSRAWVLRWNNHF